MMRFTRSHALFVGVLAVLAAHSPVLAQIKLDAPAPPPLPDGPWLSHAFLESPLPLVIPLVILGLAVVALRHHLGRPRTAAEAGAGCLLAAAVIAGVAWAVHTPRERVIESVRQLVNDTAAGDGPKVAHDLADDVQLYSSANPSGMGKDAIVSRVTAMLGPSGVARLSDHAILEAQAFVSEPSLAQVQVKVRTTPAVSGLPVISWWRMDMKPRPDGTWAATAIKLLSSNANFEP